MRNHSVAIIQQCHCNLPQTDRDASILTVYKGGERNSSTDIAHMHHQLSKMQRNEAIQLEIRMHQWWDQYDLMNTSHRTTNAILRTN